MGAATRCRVLYLFGVLLMTFDLLTCVHSQGAGGVWVTLRNTTYQNNSNVILEDIGEGDDAFFCKTNQTACCRAPYTGDMGSVGNWFFPNGTRVPSSDEEWDFHRTRGQMVIRMHRKRGGVEGIYHCEIPDAINVTQTIYIGVYSASTGARDVWFSLNGTVYQNNSIVMMENIGEDDDALLCITNQTACCRAPYTGDMGFALGNWYFPNGSRVPSSGNQWDFHRTRGHMVVRLNRRRGGEEGIYHCEIPDAMNVNQTIYIGVYSASTGARDVGFSLRNTIYQNNSIVMMENIGEGDDALLCITNQTACCQPPYNGNMGSVGNWFFPNGTRVPSTYRQWDFHRTRGQMAVLLHRRKGGVEGTYRCEIPDTFGFTQTIYIGVYSASTGARDVGFSLRNTIYQNNSIVMMENIGEGDDALLCITNQTACCRPPYTGEMGSPLGNWFFPNGSRVPSSGNQWDFHRTRGQMVVGMHRRRGGVEGIYRCEIPDTFGFTQTIYIGVYSASTGARDVWFSLNGTVYQNNSIVMMENIGEDDDALLCITNQTACCRAPYTGDMGFALGNWYFPNGSRVPSSGNQWDFHRTRGHMVVRLNRRRGGEEGIYHCEIPDAMNVNQTIYIGVYSASTGARDVGFSLRNTIYQNNSIVMMENIGEGDDALLCITNQTACCQPPYNGNMGSVGNWFFPNGTRVPSTYRQWDFHRTRGQMAVLLHRRKGGVEGTYRCEIPDTFGFTQTIYIGVYSASTGARDVGFSLRNTIYQNNSIVMMENIGEGDDALLCITNQTACCRPPYTGEMGSPLGNWFFPNGSRVPSSGNQWDFHRTRGQMVVGMHRRRGGVEGIYRCEIPDTFGFTQTIYIGVYSASTGARDVWFSLRNTIYQNNSIVMMENIGEGDDALLCITNQTACCRPSDDTEMGRAFGNWFFPNGTRVPSSGEEWDFYRSRGQMVVLLQRIRRGVEGMYRCEIPDTFGFTQTIYIGVYSASTVIQPTSSILPSLTVTSTLLQTVEPTSTPSITPDEGSKQNCNTNNLTGTTAAMAVLNIIFIAVIIVLVVALMRRGKRQVQGSAVYYDVQKSSRVEMKDNKAYGHSTVMVAETVPGCEAEYEEVDRVQVSGGNQRGGIKMKKNEAYAQPKGDNTH